MILTIQLKGITPESTHEDKLLALQASAVFMQGLNIAMKPLLIHGPIVCNPEATNIEGFLGDVNAYPNEFGVLDVAIENYRGLKIPSLPDTSPFSLYFGDTSESKVIGIDEEGKDIVEVVYAGTIS